MSPIRVLIANDDAEQRIRDVSALQTMPGIQVVATAKDYHELATAIDTLHPKVVVYDMRLPFDQILTLLAKSNQRPENERPVVIACMPASIESHVEHVMALGVKDYLIKPVSPDLLAQRIRAAVRQVEERLPEQEEDKAKLTGAERTRAIEGYVLRLVHGMGLPAHLNGTRYLVTGISLAVEHDEMLSHFSQKFYPAIAHHYAVTATSVERAIRNAIIVSWNSGNLPVTYAQLLNRAVNPADKPSNRYFISAMTRHVQLKFRLNPVQRLD